MDIRFLREACEILKKEPRYTPKFLRFNNKEIALIMLGGSLSLFKAATDKIEGNIHSRREDNKIDVVAVVFRIPYHNAAPLDGEIYFDIRVKEDAEIFETLEKRKKLLLMLFSEDLYETVYKEWEFSSSLVDKISDIGSDLSVNAVHYKSLDKSDLPFEMAKARFQKDFSIKDMLEKGRAW